MGRRYINMNRKTLGEIAQELERQKMSRYDIVVPTDMLKVCVDVGTNTISMSVPQVDGGTKYHGINEYAHGQIANKCGIPKQYYDKLRSLGKYELLANNVNEFLPDKERRLVRVLDNDVRALLSDRYRVIDNHDVLYNVLGEFRNIQEHIGMNIDVDRADITDTHMYIKASSPELTAGGRVD